MNFNTLCKLKFNIQPYDFDHNPFGFKHTNGSDISAHLPLLSLLASQCSHITEFGTRQCNSTTAFINGCRGKVISYDINIYDEIVELQNMQLPCVWEFKQQDTADPNLQIEETEFLFLDSLHTYEQVIAELKQAKYVKHYIGFHDTYSQGERSVDDPTKLGILPAIRDFLSSNTEWIVIYHVKFNHGLTIIQKKHGIL